LVGSRPRWTARAPGGSRTQTDACSALPGTASRREEIGPSGPDWLALEPGLGLPWLHGPVAGFLAGLGLVDDLDWRQRAACAGMDPSDADLIVLPRPGPGDLTPT